ncbi:ATP-dependent DNA helicase RecQ, partial [Enterococcus cecorum]|uniref:helicase-related protein n=1 Tax=Enterococcus cecorum TaxID=44008 RepID=UPI0024339C0B
VGKYYGSLSKEDKNAVLERFKTGDLQFVLATKAFGMGIDIPDITNVYHYAPTGNVVDYIQEIGRVARDKNKVEFGFGIIDFLKSDISDVKKLYGLSSIKKNELVEVIRKIVHTYNDKQHNRRLLVSPEDFKYIFSNTVLDEESLDNRLKILY